MQVFRPVCLIMFFLLAACGHQQNDPYPASERDKNTLYTAFTERPKHLDPAQSYSEDESVFTAQIYEAPLQYHYLKRPYTLIPAAAEAVPDPRYLDTTGAALPDDAPADAIKERDAQAAFEFGERAAARRLRQAELFSGGGDLSAAADGREDFEFPQGDAQHDDPSWFYLVCRW